MLKSSGRALFFFDIMENAVNRAYGSSKLKILARLQYFLNFDRYLQHLLDHDDEIGTAMCERFQSVIHIFLQPQKI